MGLQLNLGQWSSVFAVPSGIVDNNLKLASEQALKLLLFLLRHPDKLFTNGELMSATGIKNEEMLIEAIQFWVQRDVLKWDDQILSPNSSKIEQAVQTAEIVVHEKPMIDSVTKVELSRPPRFSPTEIAQKVNSSPQAKRLFELAERLYARPLKHSEQQILMSITEYAGLPEDITMMLLEYCFSIGKSSPHYIQATALAWVEDNINTIEKADETIRKLKAYTDIEKQLKQKFDYHSAFSVKQKEYIVTWTEKFKFDIEMISLAYQTTLNSAGQLSFPYMNKILENWYAKGFTTPAQVESDNAKRQEEKHLESTSSFDENTLNNKALEKYK